MNPELAYFLKINAGIALFFAFYRIFLYKDTFFYWRRAVLLCFLAISLFYPLLNIQDWVKEQQPMVIIADFYATVMLPEVTYETTKAVNWTEFALFVFGLIYVLGVSVLAIRFLFQLASIIRIRLQSRTEYIQGVRIFIPKSAAEPFSFFRWIFFRPDLFSPEEQDEILTHELTHAGQYHSLDVIFSELMCIACWINPFAWLLKQEIRNNLEYMADNHVLESGHDYKSYQFHLLGLAHQKAVTRLSNSFNMLPLKKRIGMMNKKRSKEIGKTKYLMFIPLAAMLLIISNIETVARTTRNLTREAIQVVEDTVAPNREAQPAKETSEVVRDEDHLVEAPPRNNEVAHNISPAESNEAVYDMVEQMPSFPGGNTALMEYVQKNLRYPVESHKAGEQGRVMIQFIVGKDGAINNAHVVRSCTDLLDAEAVRVVQSMPKWQPGKQNGKLVSVKYTVPISFRLSEEETKKPVDNTVFDMVEQMPEFPGGQAKLMEYISRTLKYPTKAQEAGIQGRVTIQFVVNQDGSIVNPEVVRSISPELNEEAIRVINSMPKWKPGTQRGQAVNVKYTIPIMYRLS